MKRFWLIVPALMCSIAMHAQQIQEGVASVFDDSFQGKETRYGVKYDKRELTCAHNIHQFGSLLRVTHLENKRSVLVRVIDEGPFIKGRIIELSRLAGDRLGMTGSQEAMVRVELVKRPDAANATTTAPAKETIAPSPQKEIPPTTPKSMENTSPATANPQPAAERQPTASVETVPDFSARTVAAAPQAKLVGKDYTKHGLYQVQLRKPAKQGWGVQVSSISNSDYVFQELANLQAKSFDNILVSVEKDELGKTLYKFILGPFDTEEKARNYLANLKKRHKMAGFVVNLARGNY
ncbi:MAG: septal ring lytic transglycosylase RlpA family protein [Saprospiraceae bacterium]|nr:septal ring lytic transglycosylase RlpA family protein [Saprospiraceae bacterium]